MTYPSGLDSVPTVTNGVTPASAGAFNPIINAVNAIQTFLGLVGDTASSSAGVGTVVARLKRLELMGGVDLRFSATEPADPTSTTLWVHTGLIPWRIAYWDSTLPGFVGIGLNAADIQGIPVTDATPTDGYVLGYDLASDTLVWISREAPSVITTEGDLIVGGAAGALARLGIGAAGKVLQNDGAGALEWDWPTFLDVLGLGSAPSVSAAGRAKVYYQTTGPDAGLRVSLSGAAYEAVGTGGGGGGGTGAEAPHPFLLLGA